MPSNASSRRRWLSATTFRGIVATVSVAGLVTAGSVVAAACKGEGPDAPPRQNGCIGDDCYVEGGADDDGGTGEGGRGEGGVTTGSTNPFEGIASRSARLVKDGFQSTEGPIWTNGRLLFSDTKGNTVFELKSDGTTSAFRTNAGGPNGNAMTPDGKLVTCETSRHRIVRSDATVDAGTTVLAAEFGGAPLNSPNDVVVRKNGIVYFTDPDYQASADASARQEKQALFALGTDGELTRVKEYDSKPNGIALSPDESRLYVADNTANTVARWSIGADVVPTGETKFVDVEAPDGLAIDDAGNLYVAAKSGVVVFDASGLDLGTITVDEQPANCAFGGANRKTLYITARTGLYAIDLNVPGLP